MARQLRKPTVYVAWMNFSGSTSTGRVFWDSGLGFRVARLDAPLPMEHEVLCNCGACISRKAITGPVYDLDVDLINVSHDDTPVDYQVFQPDFYKILQEQVVPKVLGQEGCKTFGRNMFVARKGRPPPDLEDVLACFIKTAFAAGYRFTTKNKRIRVDETHMPIQCSNEACQEVNEWFIQ